MYFWRQCPCNQVPRVQPDGMFQYQDVPPLLPAYNKYRGGVDLTDQLCKTYGFNRKSKRSWIHLFYRFFDLAINNAFILHKRSNEKKGLVPLRSVERACPLKVLSAEFNFHKLITLHLELYLFYCFIHFLLYIGQY